MTCYRCLVIVAAAAALAVPAQAGLFSRRPAAKGDPAQYVNELIVTARTGKDEPSRAKAVVELRQFDGAAFPQIAGVLIEVLRSDPGSSVRLEAAHSLAKLRPSSREASQALSEAASKDASFRVRWQARTSLPLYNLSVHSGSSPKELKGPDLGPAPAGDAAARLGQPAPAQSPILLPVPVKGVEVPALPPAATPPAQSASVARPLPRGPVQSPPVTVPSVPTPVRTTVPISTAEPPIAGPTEGPSLAPPP